MPRTVRIGFPGAVYHVICGGDRREPVFLERFRWDYAYQSGSRGLVSQIQTAAEWKVIDSTTWWDSQPGAVSRVQAWETTRDVLDSVENLGAGNSTLSKYDYAVNNRGQRTQVVKTGSAFAANAFHAWGYDSKGQVTSANKFLGTNTGNTSQPVNSEHFGFNYDNIGNRNWASVAGNVTANYTAGLSNQYSGIISGNTTENPVHDADGNPIEDADYLYTWDAENRLVQVERKSDSVTWTYAYDAEGRRYWAGGGSVERFFVYDGWNVIRDRQVWSGGESSDYYVWGLDLSETIHGAGGVGGLLMWLQPQSVGWSGDLELRPHWYTYDGNGNVSDLVSGEWDFTNFLDPTFSSALENHYEYGPFGEIVAATEGRPENPFKFSTKWHEGNGLVYYGYRYYNPEAGRWLNRDPIGEEGGVNTSCFIGNEPIGRLDLLGLASQTLTHDFEVIFPMPTSDGSLGPMSSEKVTVSVDASCDSSKKELSAEITGITPANAAWTFKVGFKGFGLTVGTRFVVEGLPKVTSGNTKEGWPYQQIDLRVSRETKFDLGRSGFPLAPAKGVPSVGGDGGLNLSLLDDGYGYRNYLLQLEVKCVCYDTPWIIWY